MFAFCFQGKGLMLPCAIHNEAYVVGPEKVLALRIGPPPDEQLDAIQIVGEAGGRHDWLTAESARRAVSWQEGRDRAKIATDWILEKSDLISS